MPRVRRYRIRSAATVWLHLLRDVAAQIPSVSLPRSRHFKINLSFALARSHTARLSIPFNLACKCRLNIFRRPTTALSPVVRAALSATISLSTEEKGGLREKRSRSSLSLSLPSELRRRARGMYFYVSMRERGRDAKALPSHGISISASDRTPDLERVFGSFRRIALGSGQPLPPRVASLIAEERERKLLHRGDSQAPKKLNIYVYSNERDTRNLIAINRICR